MKKTDWVCARHTKTLIGCIRRRPNYAHLPSDADIIMVCDTGSDSFYLLTALMYVTTYSMFEAKKVFSVLC